MVVQQVQTQVVQNGAAVAAQDTLVVEPVDLEEAQCTAAAEGAMEEMLPMILHHKQGATRTPIPQEVEGLLEQMVQQEPQEPQVQMEHQKKQAPEAVAAADLQEQVTMVVQEEQVAHVAAVVEEVADVLAQGHLVLEEPVDGAK